MKNLSKEEVRTAEEVLRDCSDGIAYESWKRKHNTTLQWILAAMEQYAKLEVSEYSQAYQLRQSALVNELYARIKELESQSEAVGWISVKERLPEPLIRVLTFDGLAIDFGRYFHSTKYGSIFGRHGWGQTYNITHWQPLPSNPKHNPNDS